ncbi:serine hydrolase [Crossiella sp. NPDC003009]
MLSRRHLLITGALAAGATLLPGLATAAPRATTDFTTREGLLAWLTANPGLVSAYADNGTKCLAHRAHVAQPLASAVKPVHLAAYALARLDPATKVRVGDWENFYLPYTDGGAHVAAQESLGIPMDPATLLAKDPDQLVTLDQIAGTMIYFSDNAATDYLRHLLGEPALRRAALRGGWAGADTRSKLADFLYLLLPEEVRPGVPRRDMGARLEQRFLTDPAFRAHARAKVLSGTPSWETQTAWARDSGGASAATLAGLHRALATGRFPEPARRHLEHSLAAIRPPEVAGIGFKGGSLAGVLTAGMSVRWRDGRIGTVAVLLTGMTEPDWTAATGESSIYLRSVLDLLLDPAWLDRVATALTGTPGMLS